MACDDANTATLALTTALAGPAEVSGDAGSVKQHSLGDLIEADKYLAAKCASRTARRGLRVTKLIPSGTD